MATTDGSVEGKGPTIVTPLIQMSKADIIRLGLLYGVDYSLTHSCYDPFSDGKPCLECDSCKIRIAAFKEVGEIDPVLR